MWTGSELRRLAASQGPQLLITVVGAISELFYYFCMYMFVRTVVVLDTTRTGYKIDVHLSYQYKTVFHLSYQCSNEL